MKYLTLLLMSTKCQLPITAINCAKRMLDFIDDFKKSSICKYFVPTIF